MDQRSSSVEVRARSVDDAVAQALRQLGLSSDQVEIEIIKQGSRGLLGLLSEDAVVRVTPKLRRDTQPQVELEHVEDTGNVEQMPPPLSAPQQEEVGRIGAEVLQNLLSGLGLKTRVSVEEMPLSSQSRPDSVYLNVGGEGLGVLIGRRGAILNDLQYLTCLLVSRRVQRWPNLIVDVEGYKARREKSLVELAKRMADRVRTTAQPVPLEPMPPNERRIVHLALREDPDVYTESSGEDEDRKVVIRPK